MRTLQSHYEIFTWIVLSLLRALLCFVSALGIHTQTTCNARLSLSLQVLNWGTPTASPTCRRASWCQKEDDAEGVCWWYPLTTWQCCFFAIRWPLLVYAWLFISSQGYSKQDGVHFDFQQRAVGWGSRLYSFRVIPTLGDNYTAYCLSQRDDRDIVRRWRSCMEEHGTTSTAGIDEEFWGCLATSATNPRAHMCQRMQFDTATQRLCFFTLAQC